MVEELGDRPVQDVSLGKQAGFVIAIGSLIKQGKPEVTPSHPITLLGPVGGGAEAAAIVIGLSI